MTFEDLEPESAAPLPFEWRNLPRRTVPPGGHRALASLSEWTVALDSGVHLRLDTLHQYGTYAGTLCGLPLDDEVRAWPVHALLRLAGDMFGVEGEQVAILPPELLASEVRRTVEGRPEVRTVEFLPPVACIAVFRSGERFGVIAWFQQGFGPPSSSHVMAHLASLDWPRFSLPWTP